MQATQATGEQQKRHGGRQPKNWVPQVDLPPTRNAIEEVVNALVAAWNKQLDDPAARLFFGPCLRGERRSLVSNSVYRWESEQDRRFVAAWLHELARAIEGGTFRWNSER